MKSNYPAFAGARITKITRNNTPASRLDPALMSTLIQNGPAPFSGALDPEGNNPDSDSIIRFNPPIRLCVFQEHARRNRGQQPNGPAQAREARFRTPEPSAMLYRLLCIVYPGCSLEHYSLAAQNLDGVWAVHEAANRYHLFMGVQESLETMLADPVLLEG
ncbi:hypothetical protein B0H11DRAFT_2385528 [Mycena galericulata]|nr:hypothetical protein B0H11DRAFT_2385528 [Mycena galericulata]